MTRKASKKQPKIEKKELFCRVPMEQFKQIERFSKNSNQTIPDLVRSLLNDFLKNNSVENDEEPQVELARLLFQMELLLRKLPSQEERISYFKRLKALESQLIQ
jgi:hypothetical protein